MFDEHILVDNVTGKLFRGGFETFKEDAKLWLKFAAGKPITSKELSYMTRLINHEWAEGLRLTNRTLEQAFVKGELAGMLIKYLKAMGKNTEQITDLLKKSPRPITPYYYSHLVTSIGDPVTKIKYPAH